MVINLKGFDRIVLYDFIVRIINDVDNQFYPVNKYNNCISSKKRSMGKIISFKVLNNV